MLRFEIAGRASLRVEGASKRDVELLTAAFAPYPPLAGDGPADLALVRRGSAPTLVELQRPSNDGLVTGWDGRSLVVVVGGRTCSIPDAAPATLEYEPGFPIDRALKLVRPALQLALLDHDAAAVHSAAVEIDGRGVVVAGWSESGKTETALALRRSSAPS